MKKFMKFQSILMTIRSWQEMEVDH